MPYRFRVAVGDYVCLPDGRKGFVRACDYLLGSMLKEVVVKPVDGLFRQRFYDDEIDTLNLIASAADLRGIAASL